MQEVQVIRVSGATGGTFRLVHDNTATEAIPFDASPTDLEVAIGRLPSLGRVKVKLEGDESMERDLRESAGQCRDTDDDVLTHRWHGLRRDASRWDLKTLEGKIKAAFGGSGWATIFANNTEQEVSDTLNGLGIDVSVERVFLVGGASSTLITFLERGDVPLIKVNASGLVGTGAIARVDEEVKGAVYQVTLGSIMGRGRRTRSTGTRPLVLSNLS